MADPYLGEIRLFGGNFAPLGWTFCNGALLPIAQNDALFSLIGTNYGGDGQNTFGVPNLQGRIPVHQGTYQGTTFPIGQIAGTETVTLTAGQMPVHSHTLACSSTTGTQPTASGNIVAGSAATPYTTTLPPNLALNNATLSVSGGSQPHDNMMPFQCVSFILALEGIYPSRN